MEMIISVKTEVDHNGNNEWQHIESALTTDTQRYLSKVRKAK